MKEIISSILPYAQVIISILLIISVLLQQTGAMVGAGGAFGGGASSVQSTRRGLEKTLLKFTTFLAILFFIISVTAILIK